jgi:hypothetical protein
MTRRAFLGAVLAIALLGAVPSRAAEWLIAFQAIPDSNDAVYNKQAAETAGIVSELGPQVLGAIGLDPGMFDADVVIGGYRGRTSPSVVLHVDGEMPVANRAAAACGVVFAQKSVLVWRDGGEDGAVAVAFPTLSPTLADFFFRNAIAVDAGLGGGFTARDDRQLLFINLRGADGKPLSGLDDAKFEAGLRKAAAAFGGIATITTMKVDAHLLAESGYGEALGGSAAVLDPLRRRRDELVAAPR